MEKTTIVTGVAVSVGRATAAELAQRPGINKLWETCENHSKKPELK